MPRINSLDTQRERIRDSLDAISNDLAMEMRDAGFGSIPIYIVVPQTGDALAALVTPLDPSDENWSLNLQIAYRVIQEKIGCGKIWSRALACAMVNGPIAAAEVATQ
jgi:hypothetical protein